MGDFYDDDEDEDDNNGNYNEEDHCPCLFQKVLPMQSMEIPTVRTTTTTSFYDMTQQPTSWSDEFLAEGGVMTIITMTKIRTTTMMTTITTTT